MLAGDGDGLIGRTIFEEQVSDAIDGRCVQRWLLQITEPDDDINNDGSMSSSTRILLRLDESTHNRAR